MPVVIVDSSLPTTPRNSENELSLNLQLPTPSASWPRSIPLALTACHMPTLALPPAPDEPFGFGGVLDATQCEQVLQNIRFQIGCCLGIPKTLIVK